jgi:hypothetical protein
LNQKQKDFIYNLIFCLPFSVLGFDLLLGSTSCITYNSSGLPVNTNYFCLAKPEFLTHSAYYDFFYLRADFSNVLIVSHWSSELLLVIFFFTAFALTKNSVFAFSALVLYAIQHEIFWFITLAQFGYGETAGGVKITFWLVGYIAVSIYFLWEYRKVFLTKEYLACCIAYWGYLFVQWIYSNYQPNNETNFAFNFTGTVSWLIWTILIIILVWRKRKLASPPIT